MQEDEGEGNQPNNETRRPGNKPEGASKKKRKKKKEKKKKKEAKQREAMEYVLF